MMKSTVSILVVLLCHASAAPATATTTNEQEMIARRQTEQIGTCNGSPKTFRWFVNELGNSYGAYRCRSGCDCDGTRYCSPDRNGGYGICAGSDGRTNGATPGVCNGIIKPTTWTVNEATNSYGANKCRSDCDCDGQRYCGGNGVCAGSDGRNGQCIKGANYYYNEALTLTGPNSCLTSCQCDGNRFCVLPASNFEFGTTKAGYCSGTSRP